MSSATALDAYWRFFASFNSRDGETFSGALNYPHVRVSSRGTPAVVPTLADHAATATWDRVLATGWDHTNGHEPRVVHESPDRAHVVGGWTRVDADGGNVLMNRVTYIVTGPVPAGESSADSARTAAPPRPAARATSTTNTPSPW